ncbi:MAG: hypothetical protein ACP5MD_14950 [Verrucomicrobiia bacterium]
MHAHEGRYDRRSYVPHVATFASVRVHWWFSSWIATRYQGLKWMQTLRVSNTCFRHLAMCAEYGSWGPWHNGDDRVSDRTRAVRNTEATLTPWSERAEYNSGAGLAYAVDRR